MFGCGGQRLEGINRVVCGCKLACNRDCGVPLGTSRAHEQRRTCLHVKLTDKSAMGYLQVLGHRGQGARIEPT